MENRIRSLEELQKCNYENLTYGEIVEYNLECSEYCPLYGEFCRGGVVCYGGEPIEPPCCSFKDEDVLQEKYDKFLYGRYCWEQKLKEKEEKQRIKEEKSKIRKQKLREYKWRNYEDLQKIKDLKKYIKDYNNKLKQIDRLDIYAIAVNSTNEFFIGFNCSCPNDIDRSKLQNGKDFCINEIKKCEEQINNIKLKIKENEKKFKEKENDRI